MTTLSATLADLLDRSASLGVGLADARGLLVEAAGSHGGLEAASVAALLARHHPRELEALLGSGVDEGVLLGERHCFYLRWFPDRERFVYLMAERSRANGELRGLLDEAARHLLLGLRPSAAPKRERLEQPRQFLARLLVR